MKCRYDLHIHSALSPCAENDMTPVTIVGTAKVLGLDFVAIADHNSIKNVEVALKAGEAYGINVVPAIELQTNEDIHILCLFETYERLKAFYDDIEFSDRDNREEIFGEQLVYDEDDNVVDKEKSMLLDSAKISSVAVPSLVKMYGGVAVPAHIDRDGNSMLTILGTVEEGYSTVELSTKADTETVNEWSKKYRVIIDSDSHVLDTISVRGEIELEECSVKCLLRTLKTAVSDAYKG